MTETPLLPPVRDRRGLMLSAAEDPDAALAVCCRFRRQLLKLGIGHRLAVTVHALERGRWGVFLTEVVTTSDAWPVGAPHDW